MSAPMLDLAVKNVVEYGLELIRQDPDHHLKDIFGDYTLDAHRALYADLIPRVKKWVNETEIPVILGFDLTETELPCVTVNLSGSSPDQQFMGDHGHQLGSQQILRNQSDIVIPAFVPKSLIWSADKTYMILTPPDGMPFEQQQLFLPGLKLRDGQSREYTLSQDDDGNILVLQDDDAAPLSAIDLSKLEVVSPVIDARFRRGTMLFNDAITVAIHAHTNRNEGLWLYYIVMWTLLKFRPILEGCFGLALSTPSSSDFSKSPDFQAENVWQRFITMSCKTAWSWEGARQQDIIGLILSIQTAQAGNADTGN